MKRNGRTIALLALILAGLVLVGGAGTAYDDLDRFGPNPFDVPTPHGVEVPVAVIARYQGGGPAGEYIAGVTVTLTSLDDGQPQSLTTRGGPPIQDRFEAVAGQTYAATASYGASTASTVVTITSFGDPNVLLFGRPSEPSGGHLLVTIRPSDGAILHLGYSVVHGSLTPDPRMALPTPTGTPVPVRLDAYYLDPATQTASGHVAGISVSVFNESQAPISRVTDELGWFNQENKFELLAGNEYTVIADWGGSTMSAEVVITSIGPSRKYAVGGLITVRVDPTDQNIIDISYTPTGIA